MQSSDSFFHSTIRAVVSPRVFGFLPKRGGGMHAVSLVLSLTLCGAWVGVRAQTAHFAWEQSFVASAATNGLGKPYGIAIDGSGNIYIADTGNGRILKEALSGGNFGTVNVGSKSKTSIPLIFTFDTSGTLGSTAVVTQGAKGQDFVDAGTGSCKAGTTYTAGETCAVEVSFEPKFSGTRYGAAELTNSSGKVIATGYVQGTGVGPQVNFLPGSQIVVADATTKGLIGPVGVTIDDSGNVYVADYQNSQVLKETPSAGGYSQTVIANTATNGLDYPFGIAVDGGGNVYIADYNNNRVLKETLSAGSYTQSVVADSAINGLSYPEAVAVDGSGNVYIADGSSRVLKETLSAGGYAQSIVASAANNGLETPQGVAVDGSGNVYIADSGSSLVLKETLSAGSYIQSIVASAANNGLETPQGVAVDGNGNVYITDSGNSQVLKETLLAGSYIQSVLANSASNRLYVPYGVAIDKSGNVYVADWGNSRVLKEDFADPPSLTFASTTVGTTSNDSPQTVRLENIGNAALSFPIPGNGENPSISPSFTLNNSEPSACPLLSSSSSSSPGALAPGESCLLQISFSPKSAGSLSGSLSLTDNALNVGGSTQSISLSGKGIPAPATLTSPTEDSTLTGSSVEFEWTPVAGIDLFDLHLSTIGWGASDVHSSGPVYGTSLTVTGLPTNGARIYARLYSFVNGAWEGVDYTFTAWEAQPVITSPPPVRPRPADSYFGDLQ